MVDPKTGCSNPEILVKELDIAGRRVEALDRSMITIRQLYFVVLGILAAGLAAFVRGLDIVSLLGILMVLSFIVLGAGFILWRLDSHYHQYLREAVYTCEAIEKRLGFNKKNHLGLSTNLEEFRDDSQSGKIIAAEIYVAPPVLIMAGLLSATIAYGIGPGVDTFYIETVTLEGALLILLVMWLLEIRRFTHID